MPNHPMPWGLILIVTILALIPILANLLNREGRDRDRQLESTPGDGLYAADPVRDMDDGDMGQLLSLDETGDTADDDTRNP